MVCLIWAITKMEINNIKKSLDWLLALTPLWAPVVAVTTVEILDSRNRIDLEVLSSSRHYNVAIYDSRIDIKPKGISLHNFTDYGRDGSLDVERIFLPVRGRPLLLKISDNDIRDFDKEEYKRIFEQLKPYL